MDKSSSGRHRAGSEASSKSERRRNGEGAFSVGRAVTESATSSSRRKPSQRDDYDGGAAAGAADDTSRPLRTKAYPSAESSYAPALTAEPSEISVQYPDEPTRGSELDRAYKEARRLARKSDRNSRHEMRSIDNDPRKAGRKDSERSRRDSRKSSRSDRKGSTRTYSNDEASLPQNQFPGEVPNTYTRPYRPAGLASDYYGDQGESVAFQPGVRPNPPSIVTSAEQAHLMEPTIEAKPPPEPSSLGQVGAAATYFGGGGYSSDSGLPSTPSKPSQKPNLKPNKPNVHSTHDASPRTSPGLEGNVMMPQIQGASGGNAFTTPATTAAVGAAAEYYSGSGGAMAGSTQYQTPIRPPASAYSNSTPYSAPAGIGGSHEHSNTALYSGAALAGAAAGVHMSAHSHNEPSQGQYHGSATAFYPSSQTTQMSHTHRRKRKGPISKLVDWFRDPEGVAQFERYTEAIGVCKYCFDPMSTPADAPRKHHYRRRRPSSGSRHGSANRVDKTYRYSSDEERWKRSALKKGAVAGLAGYGAAKMGNAYIKSKYDFDDAYSVKSGRPANGTRVGFRGDDKEYERNEWRYSSSQDVRLTKGESGRGNTTSVRSKEKKRRPRRSGSSSSSSSSRGISRGAAISAGVGLAGLALGSEAIDKMRRTSGSRSPSSRKKYSSDRIPPDNSYENLSTTNSGGGLLDFFTSPSANERKGKKPKGLFTWGNGSSSSSDADLAFESRPVRRKISHGRLKKGGARRYRFDSTTELKQLLADGQRLADEGDRRTRKGKGRYDANVNTGRPSYSGSYGDPILDNEPSKHGHEDEWYDTGDDELDLAYGGGISAMQSQETLVQEKRSSRRTLTFEEPPPSASSRPMTEIGSLPVSNGASHERRFPMNHDDLPPMQEIEPRPISDPKYPDKRGRSRGKDPGDASSLSHGRKSSASVPLEQPQPILPVTPFLQGASYNTVDSGRPYPGFQQNDSNLDSLENSQAQPAERKTGHRPAIEISGSTRPRRRDSSPAKLPFRNARNNVSFNLTDEQLENEKRNRHETGRPKAEGGKSRRRKSADAALIMGGAATLGAEILREDSEPASEGRSAKTKRTSPDASDDQLAKIEQELQRLYAERRRLKERSPKQNEEGSNGVSASAPASTETTVVKDKVSTISDDTATPRRKSSLKKTAERDNSPHAESQQERIARMAAQRVKSTSSPVYEDYGAFFVPTELKEHLKEHNDKAEHRDDIEANIVEIVPGAAKSRRQHPFDPFTYRPFGLALDDDPGLHPWPVPMLELIEPTPPGSESHSVQGDASPIITPKSTEASTDMGEPLERKVSSGSKVTWGDHDTYVYEVQTPDDERSEYIPHSGFQKVDHFEAPSPGEAARRDVPYQDEESLPTISRVWTLDDGEAEKLEHEVPVLDDRPQISRTWTVDDIEADQIEHEPPRDKPGDGSEVKIQPKIVEVQPKSSPSPNPLPVSTEREELSQEPSVPEPDEGGRRQAFYNSPSVETPGQSSLTEDGADNLKHPSAADPQKPTDQQHFEQRQNDFQAINQESLEGNTADREIPDTSPAVRVSKSEKRRLERASSSGEAVDPYLSQHTSQDLGKESVAPPSVPGSESVFDYLKDNEGDSAPSASILGLGASTILPADQLTRDTAQPSNAISSKEAEDVDLPSKPKRSSTFDDSRTHRSRSNSKTDYRSDPEDWERSRDSKKLKKSKRGSRSDAGTSSKSSKSRDQGEADEASFRKLRRSRSKDDMLDGDDSRSFSFNGASSNVDSETSSKRSTRAKDEERRPRKHKNRDSDILGNDDSHSIASSPSDLEKRSKEKKSDSFIGRLFSGNKSDVSTSSKKSSRSPESEGRADQDRDIEQEKRKKRKSKEKDLGDATSEPARRTRRNSDPSLEPTSYRTVSRDQSVDDGFVSAEEIPETPLKPEDIEPFLGTSPEMPPPTVISTPMGIDGVSGLASEREPSNPPSAALDTHLDTPTNALSEDNLPSKRLSHEIDELEESSKPGTSTNYPASRRLSAIRTTDGPSSPIVHSSPTAVPLNFRRPPLSPTNPRFSMSSPMASPSSPLTTPRTRQGRPKSTEFRSSKEFRPLYLVERQNFAKASTPEAMEEYPSLPSSKTSSAHPSMEDLRAEAQAREHPDEFTPSRFNAEMFRDRGRRHSYSYWHDNDTRRESPDYLDSRSATPVPGEAQRAWEREKKPKPKYEFHSPSELLQDPALLREVPAMDDGARPASPLPSVVSTDLDQEYMSARSRSLSPRRSRSLSRGRRGTSRSRSTSSIWQDAVTTAATGSALGIAAYEMSKGAHDDQPNEDVVTPTKSQFVVDMTTEAPKQPESRPDDVILEEEVLVRQSPPNVDQTLDSARSQPQPDPPITGETPQSAGVDETGSSEARKRSNESDSTADVATASPEANEKAGDNENAGDTTSLLQEPLKQNSDSSKETMISREIGNGELAESNTSLHDPTPSTQGDVTADAPEDDKTQPSATKAKKLKKSKIARKKKRNTLSFDEELPATPESSLTASDTPANTLDKQETAPAASFSATPLISEDPLIVDDKPHKGYKEPIDEPMDTALSKEADTSAQSEPGQGPSGYFEAGNKLEADPAAPHLIKFDNQLTDASYGDRNLAPEVTVAPASNQLPIPSNNSPETLHADMAKETELSPFEQALEAAVQARGLSEGSTVEAAHQAFQQETDERQVIGDTSLTTVMEENEVPTTAVEKETRWVEDEPTDRSKSSKKARRNAKRASKKSSRSNDQLESQAATDQPVLENAAEIVEQGARPEQNPTEPFLSNIDVSHRMIEHFKEPPNPFGDDFEIQKGESALPTPAAVPQPSLSNIDTTSMENEPAEPQPVALVEPAKPEAEDDDRYSSPKRSKKKKNKDKKNKGASFDWGDAGAERSDSIAESRPSLVPSDSVPDIREDPSESISTEEFIGQTAPLTGENVETSAGQENILASADTRHQDSGDLWRMDSRKTKKRPHKKKSIAWVDEDVGAPTTDEQMNVAAPESQSTEDSRDKPSNALTVSSNTVSRDQSVDEQEPNMQHEDLQEKHNLAPALETNENAPDRVLTSKDMNSSYGVMLPDAQANKNQQEQDQETAREGSGEVVIKELSTKSKKEKNRNDATDIATVTGAAGALLTLDGQNEGSAQIPTTERQVDVGNREGQSNFAIDSASGEEVQTHNESETTEPLPESETVRHIDSLERREQIPRSALAVSDDVKHETSDQTDLPVPSEAPQLIEEGFTDHQIVSEPLEVGELEGAARKETTARDFFLPTSKKKTRNKKPKRSSTFDEASSDAKDKRLGYDGTTKRSSAGPESAESDSQKVPEVPQETALDDAQEFGFKVKPKRKKSKTKRTSFSHDLVSTPEDSADQREKEDESPPAIAEEVAPTPHSSAQPKIANEESEDTAYVSHEPAQATMESEILPTEKPILDDQTTHESTFVEGAPEPQAISVPTDEPRTDEGPSPEDIQISDGREFSVPKTQPMDTSAVTTSTAEDRALNFPGTFDNSREEDRILPSTEPAEEKSRSIFSEGLSESQVQGQIMDEPGKSPQPVSEEPEMSTERTNPPVSLPTPGGVSGDIAEEEWESRSKKNTKNAQPTDEINMPDIPAQPELTEEPSGGSNVPELDVQRKQAEAELDDNWVAKPNKSREEKKKRKPKTKEVSTFAEEDQDVIKNTELEQTEGFESRSENSAPKEILDFHENREKHDPVTQEATSSPELDREPANVQLPTQAEPSRTDKDRGIEAPDDRGERMATKKESNFLDTDDHPQPRATESPPENEGQGAQPISGPIEADSESRGDDDKGSNTKSSIMDTKNKRSSTVGDSVSDPASKRAEIESSVTSYAAMDTSTERIDAIDEANQAPTEPIAEKEWGTSTTLAKERKKITKTNTKKNKKRATIPLQGAQESSGTQSLAEDSATLNVDWPSPSSTKTKKKNKKKRPTLDEGVVQPPEASMQIAGKDELDFKQPDAVMAETSVANSESTPANVSSKDESDSTPTLKDSEMSKPSATGDDDVEMEITEARSTDRNDLPASQTHFSRTASPEPMEALDAGEETPIIKPDVTPGHHLAPEKPKVKRNESTKDKKVSKKEKRKSVLPWESTDQETSETAERSGTQTEENASHFTHTQDAQGISTPLKEPVTSIQDEPQVDPISREMPTMPTYSDQNIIAEEPANEMEITMSTAPPDDIVMAEDHGKTSMPLTEHPGITPSQEEPTDFTAQPIEDISGGMTITDRQDIPDERGLADNDTDVAMKDNGPPKRKESKNKKRSKKERRIFEFNGTEEVAPLTLEATGTQQVETANTMPEESMDVFNQPLQVPETDQPTDDVENMSDVSASTRERRKRRRSPLAWSGEEPADLPKDRSLTPPPDHDDIMDTALGVAAGLGFGSGEHDPTRESRPKSVSPARQPSAGWSFAKFGPVGGLAQSDLNRDSGVQFESPLLPGGQFASQRDSGFIPGHVDDNTGVSGSTDVDNRADILLRPTRPQSPTSSTEDVSRSSPSRSHQEEVAVLETPRRKPSPVESTSKDPSSVLFNSSPADPTPTINTVSARSPEPILSPLRRSPSVHGRHHNRDELRQKAKAILEPQRSDQLASNLIDRAAAAEVSRSTFEPPAHDTMNPVFSPTRNPLNPIREDTIEASSTVREASPFSEPPAKDDNGTAGLVAAIGAAGSVGASLSGLSRDSTGAKSLGRSMSRTSLRNLRGTNLISPYDPANFASGSSQMPVNDKDPGESVTRGRDMAEVYDGYGSYPGSPRSPTRPPSVRRRQSMQQIKDLEARLDQLASENRALAEAKMMAEQHLEQAHFERNRSENSAEALRTTAAHLQERDAEIARLKEEIASLIATHESLKKEHEQNLLAIRQEHEQARSQWEESSRELDTLRSRHTELSTGMESIVKHEIDTALVEKNAEIERLREELETARENIRELQSKILEKGVDGVVVFRDEDYFDSACQKLCQQVQAWVLRFSKYSDTRICRTTNEVRDDKIVDRFDNAILDGSDVDVYLADRVKRRDVFMSVVMSMIWEYVFTRYLFGMDREQRQKLKQLEKNLGEVGPASAVRQWRALTLTLLCKRESFKAQRESDTEAVAIEIFATLSKFLPPPHNLEQQIVGSLRNVMHAAVDLSIEMRTQRAEYVMLPPLQPEYDTNGDLVRKVYFNASLMNERSGETTSNEELEQNQAVVRMVLFPLVVKKGDDNGFGDEEIVVCPAQVLIARPDKGKKVKASTRVASGGSQVDRMSVDTRSLRAPSTHSLGAVSGIDMNDNVF
ncbi:uncharacterized protein Z518_01745 [Rhinocladiella mackenziei CBS 650.93]|uniref:Involucrin repeat protein n=1 Tax=Rhinocladiella mackenziei CBS 650.93 TaxID=1442369 RepID=A0A0D2J4M1_9EURO|nr:uncharacterized protein Z518_01745 [Rhinocladiella mackenziei CBS 650.93]KIX10661.1 hypothetical protein Z518_01745 [Rhinocladiella mackenziei CBS 650.93]